MNTKKLLTCGAIGGPLFVITFLIEGATRADYNWLRHPVSALALGDFGWIQVASFIITGSLILAFAIGLWLARRGPEGSTWGALLVGVVAIGHLGAGIFITDPILGYPPGTPAEHTWHGQLHGFFAIPVFVGLPLTCFVFSRRFAKSGRRGWTIYSAMIGLTMVAFFILAIMGFSHPEGLEDFVGLLQRITITAGLGWLTSLAIHLRRAQSKAHSAGCWRNLD